MDVFDSERQIFYKTNNNRFQNIELEITKIKSLNYLKLNIFEQMIEKYVNSDYCFGKMFVYPTYFIKDVVKNKCVSYVNSFGDFTFTNAENVDSYWLLDNYNNARYHVSNDIHDVLDVKILWVGIYVKVNYNKNISYKTLTDTVNKFLNNAIMCTDQNDLTVENVKLFNKEFSNFIMESNSHE